MSSKLHPDSRVNPDIKTRNSSDNESIHDLIEQYKVNRRGFLKTSLGATAGAGAAAVLGANVVDSMVNFAEAAPVHMGRIGFASVPANIVPMIDAVTVPTGYSASVLVSWGDSLSSAQHWNPSGAMSESTQKHCYGAHTDGMHYFPFPGPLGNARGLLVTNSEYCDPALVNNIAPASAYASAALTLDMVRAQQAAHGVNVVAVGKDLVGKGRGEWKVVRHSPFNRRITGNTPCKISGPAAGHALMKTAANPNGKRALGTLNNCAHGDTPWGTYLTCEENWNGYFGTTQSFTQTNDEKRYGVAAAGFGYRWHEVDARFDVRNEPNEPHRFGWVVEIDPFDPDSTPIKRTALGRFKHEGAEVVVDDKNRVAVYMGDDERNEYIYKFVCARKYNPRNQKANRDLLDDGTLYVAKFNADGSGEWLPLVWGDNGLTPENGFTDQGEVLIKCRQAADRLGATMMDRPEWGTAHPVTREMYMTLTNNSRRGNTPVSSNNVDGTTAAATANPVVDAANPRPDNDFGHIIRWRDANGRADASRFQWDLFVQCGDKSTSKTLGGSYTPGEFGGQAVGYSGNINGDDYGAPDGLWFDRDGRLWIQTDQAGNATGDWVNIGGNVMMCANPTTGETRRFLTSPKNCEVTGVTATPDGKTMFVGIQHPGEDWVATFTDNSTWPDSGANGPTTASGQVPFKPRSSVMVITRDNNGVIGT
ncbi:MAG: PhoX family phosphatase [Gammaproteobacteria bacterium]|nr:PhoX family phosphatase [Gammaproteobacteria bacterium]